jgi:hypothetical protein
MFVERPTYPSNISALTPFPVTLFRVFLNPRSVTLDKVI